MTTTTVPRIGWDELDAWLAAPADGWRQGDHVTLLGPTGRGKTTLLKALLAIRERRHGHVCVIGTKPKDRSIDALRERGYRRVRKWDEVRVHDRLVLLWPKFSRLGGKAAQRWPIAEALDVMFEAGGWCIAFDEADYACDDLHLADDVSTLLKQGRAVNLSIVGGAQRPRHLPLTFLSQATHLFLWPTGDRYDLKRLSELGGANVELIRDVLPSLDPTKFDVLYVNTRDGRLAITQPPK